MILVSLLVVGPALTAFAAEEATTTDIGTLDKKSD
jgi:hypothetical protein